MCDPKTAALFAKLETYRPILEKSPMNTHSTNTDPEAIDLMREVEKQAFKGFALLADICHADAHHAGWWTDLASGEDLRGANNTPEKLMLIVSEISEAMEGHRKNLKDDKLPHRSMLEVELADAVIRICDLAGAKKLDLAGAVKEKLEYNRTRADHKIENRKASGGKAY